MSVFDGPRGAKPDWNSVERIPARRLMYFVLNKVLGWSLSFFLRTDDQHHRILSSVDQKGLLLSPSVGFGFRFRGAYR